MTTEYQVDEDSDALALPVLAPSDLPRSKVNVNDFHCMQGHSDEYLLKVTAGKLGIGLEGKIQPCADCSMVKGSRRKFPVAPLIEPTRRLAEYLWIFIG